MDDALIRIVAQHVLAVIDGPPDRPPMKRSSTAGATQLGTVRLRTWRRSSEIQFKRIGPADPDWATDWDAVDGSITDSFDTGLG